MFLLIMVVALTIVTVVAVVATVICNGNIDFGREFAWFLLADAGAGAIAARDDDHDASYGCDNYGAVLMVVLLTRMTPAKLMALR
eukprot:1304792-Rhodomonas_salina.2